MVTNAYMLQFCKSSSTASCPAMGEYPSVGEGEISPAGCPEGFRGYVYRECQDGVLGEVKMGKCEYKVPDRLQYENNNRVFVLGIPSYWTIITEFSMQEDTPLPEGFTLNPQTGEITGKATAEMEVTNLVMGKLPKKTFVDHHVPAVLKPLVLPEQLTVMQALDRVLRLLWVGSKRFLLLLWLLWVGSKRFLLLLWLLWLVTSKVDRWVRGLIARQQCCTCR